MHFKKMEELFSVVEEMAKPRLAASVREGAGKTSMAGQTKFVTGELLHNCNTKEDGFVTKVYAVGEKVMYEVAVHATPNTWVQCYLSDWSENTLEPSPNPDPIGKDGQVR